MQLGTLIERHEPAFLAQYGARLTDTQRRALRAIKTCRTSDAGTVRYGCGACAEQHSLPRSCGHRSCPQCQNHDASAWLERQQTKLLPVEYFMVTFTLPYELRALAWREQKRMYTLLLAAATATLKDFGHDPKWLGGALGMTAVLHTHSRRLDFHPHCHIIIPGGGVDRRRRQWRKPRGKYLFNGFALAAAYRGRMIEAMIAHGLPLPAKLLRKWVAHCEHVGSGLPALKYLSRYLYRGVISERDIVSDEDGQVTFRYREGKTGKTCYRTLPGAEFLWLVLQHVLPKGFRRVRDYGFLHGNAKRQLVLVQLVLRVVIEAAAPRPRPVVPCPACRAPMRVIDVLAPGAASG